VAFFSLCALRKTNLTSSIDVYNVKIKQISQIANRVFAFEEKLKIYYEEIRNFLTLTSFARWYNIVSNKSLDNFKSFKRNIRRILEILT